MGSRIFPSKTDWHDNRLGYRIDQGHWYGNGSFGLIVQKNGQLHRLAIAKTTVNPKVDKGPDIADRLWIDAIKWGYL